MRKTRVPRDSLLHTKESGPRTDFLRGCSFVRLLCHPHGKMDRSGADPRFIEPVRRSGPPFPARDPSAPRLASVQISQLSSIRQFSSSLSCRASRPSHVASLSSPVILLVFSSLSIAYQEAALVFACSLSPAGWSRPLTLCLEHLWDCGHHTRFA